MFLGGLSLNLSKPYLRLAVTFVIVATFHGCKSTSSKLEAEVQASVVGKATKNIVLIFSSSKTAPELQTEIERMTSIFRTDLVDQGYKVEAMGAESESKVLNRIQEASARLTSDGSLILAFECRSDAIGSLQMDDGGVLKYAEIGKTVMLARKTPLRRTIFIVDSRISAGTKLPAKEEQERILESELLGSTDWYNSEFGKDQGWSRLATDKQRLKDASLSESSELGEVIALSSVMPEQVSGAQGALGAFADAIKNLYGTSQRSGITVQDLLKSYQNSRTFEKYPSTAVFAPANITKSSVFDISGETNTSDQRVKTLGLAWLNQVSKQLNATLEGCTFSPEYGIGYSTKTFLFDPSFIVTTKSGQVFHDQYFGVMNWMSRPETSVQFISRGVAKQAALQYAHLGCQERKPD